MCDPVIDEHFRRSLGKDYMTLFAKKTTASKPNNHPEEQDSNGLSITGLSGKLSYSFSCSKTSKFGQNHGV